MDNEKRYDNLYNEGNAGGYNPYRNVDSNVDSKESAFDKWDRVDNRMSKIVRILNGISSDPSDDARRNRHEDELAELEILAKEICPW